jgi:hypothetical protein
MKPVIAGVVLSVFMFVAMLVAWVFAYGEDNGRRSRDPEAHWSPPNQRPVPPPRN